VSRSAARRGVGEQEQRKAEAQISAERAAEKQRQEEEEGEFQTPVIGCMAILQRLLSASSHG
jgi:hypothetical protein